MAVPTALETGVKVSTPLLLMAGCTVNSALLLFVTVKLIVCDDSFAGPGEMLVTTVLLD